MSEDRVVDVRQRILAENDRRAQEMRRAFRDRGTLVVNLISSPGSGKTTLLEQTIHALRDRYRLGVLVGDIATERDAQRLRDLGIPAHQILTGGACHLDARQIHAALEEIEVADLDFLFIENVGNLICPTSYDLGEDYKVVLLSVTEGEDKPFKYPAIFSRARITLVTKADLMPHVEFSLDEVREQVRSLCPQGRLLVVSAKGEPGIGEWTQSLEEELRAKRDGET